MDPLEAAEDMPPDTEESYSEDEDLDEFFDSSGLKPKDREMAKEALKSYIMTCIDKHLSGP